MERTKKKNNLESHPFNVGLYKIGALKLIQRINYFSSGRWILKIVEHTGIETH